VRAQLSTGLSLKIAISICKREGGTGEGLHNGARGPYSGPSIFVGPALAMNNFVSLVFRRTRKMEGDRERERERERESRPRA